MADFLTAVRQRTATNAPPETAHRSCALVHLAEIAFRTQGQLNFDPSQEQFMNADEANRMLSKIYRSPYGLPEI
jgi:hypothetical protein